MVFDKKLNSRCLLNVILNSVNCDLYSVLDNQEASKNNFQATTFKGEENSRTFQDCVSPRVMNIQQHKSKLLTTDP